jgi:hypothetical protein
MRALSRFRQWINRDDGRLYRVGNGPVNVLEIAGTLLFVAALILSELHRHIGISKIWAIAAAIFGMVLFATGSKDKQP